MRALLFSLLIASVSHGVTLEQLCDFENRYKGKEDPKHYVRYLGCQKDGDRYVFTRQMHVKKILAQAKAHPEVRALGAKGFLRLLALKSKRRFLERYCPIIRKERAEFTILAGVKPFVKIFADADVCARRDAIVQKLQLRSALTVMSALKRSGKLPIKISRYGALENIDVMPKRRWLVLDLFVFDPYGTTNDPKKRRDFFAKLEQRIPQVVRRSKLWQIFLAQGWKLLVSIHTNTGYYKRFLVE